MTHDDDRLSERQRGRILAVLEADRPGDAVDRAVMAVLRDRRQGRRPRLSVWLAAAAAVIVSLSVGMWFLPRAEAPVAGGTVLVQFEFQAPDAERVQLAGSFNGWQPSTDLVRHPATGIWRVTVPLVPGDHEYLVVVDGVQWVPDPAAHAQVDDGFGQANSLIVVGPRGVIRS